MRTGDVCAGHRQSYRVPRAPALIPAVVADGRSTYFAEHLWIKVVVVQVSEVPEHREFVVGVPIDFLVGCGAIEGERCCGEIIIARGTRAGTRKESSGRF